MIGEEAGVIAAGETLTAEDKSFIDRRTDAKLAELYALGLTPFDIEGTIPQAYLLPLARVVAAEIAPGYGIEVQLSKTLGAEALRALHRLKAQPHYGDPQVAVYY
jgi:hypothetical protein